MSIDLTNRVAIVTGAGGGFGRSHALALARPGERVVVNDKSGAAAEAVAMEIQAAGGTAIGFAASVAEREAMDAMVAITTDRWDRVDARQYSGGYCATAVSR